MTNLSYHCDPETDGTHHNLCPKRYEKYINLGTDNEDFETVDCECYCHDYGVSNI
jgi:hypothetical protein